MIAARIMVTAMVFGLALPSATAQRLPPIRSPMDALQQLSLKSAAQQVAALANFKKACRGRLRHTLKDNKQIIVALTKLSASPSAEVKKGVMDSARCLAPANFPTLLAPQLDDARPKVRAYALEIAAQVQEAPVTTMVLDRLEKQAQECRNAKLAPAEVEVCVWLSYTPGATLKKSSARPLRERAAKLAAAQFASPHAKVREVSVETVTAAGLKEYAEAIGELIDDEKAGKFPKKNSKLLSRFKTRMTTLEKKGD